MLSSLLFVVAFNLAMFLIAYKRQTDVLTDISYALSFAAIAIFGAFSSNPGPEQLLVLFMVFLWSARLGGFLVNRIRVFGHDSRFDKMRKSFWQFGRFWLLQAVTAWVVMLPVMMLLDSPNLLPNMAIINVGLVLSFTGLMIESVADWQKFKFKSSGSKNWIDDGLWRYSRHPNYFGEILMWSGMFIASTAWLEFGAAVIALASPLLITTLLLFVSGMPMLEKMADKKWGKNKKYQDYKKSTSPLILLPKFKQ